MEFKDYYAALGVAKTATEKEIKQAYRRLARKLHPDVNPGDRAAETHFKEINEAYEVLGDPGKRRRYDELGANWRAYEQAQRAGDSGYGGWTVDLGGGAQGFRTMTADELRNLFGDEDPFSDFFKTFFGGAGPRAAAGRQGRSARAARGGDIEGEVDLTLEEVGAGARRRVMVTRNGQARSVDVRVPAGVRDGSRIRVAGKGQPGAAGGTTGDLYLRVRLLPHPRFERKGDDLHLRVPINMTTAVLGGEAHVETIEGRPLRLKIPSLTQNGQVFRLKGHGLPVLNTSGQHGDLYATVDVQLPRHLTAEQRAHYEALARLERGSRDSAA